MARLFCPPTTALILTPTSHFLTLPTPSNLFNPTSSTFLSRTSPALSNTSPLLLQTPLPYSPPFSFQSHPPPSIPPALGPRWIRLVVQEQSSAHTGDTREKRREERGGGRSSDRRKGGQKVACREGRGGECEIGGKRRRESEG